MDENRAAEFTGRVLADSAAAATIVLAALGDRTGLFKDMAEHGPATSGELASRTGLSERRSSRPGTPPSRRASPTGSATKSWMRRPGCPAPTT